MVAELDCKIDVLAQRVELLISQNEETLEEYETEYTPFSEATPDSGSVGKNVDTEELFS